MEPLKGFWSCLWSFLRFLPFFLALLILGTVKGIILCPFVCLIMTLGNSAIILGLWPAHVVWTYYCMIRSKQLGPVLKFILALGASIILVLWPLVGILGSILIGVGYGFLAPVVATFDAVGEGKANNFLHCFMDGTWSTIERSFTVVRDFRDVCFYSYFSIMDDLHQRDPPNEGPYEIRLWYVPGSWVIGFLGVMVDMPTITLIAIYKSPYMLFKGWKRLFQDLIGREGPFLETACVPFAGLAILLWPMAVAGAIIASILSSFFLGAYAAVITYQEKSAKMGLFYIISSLSLFDEYSNDILDMPEGSCFPRYQYRKNISQRSKSLSRHSSLARKNQDEKNPSLRATSFKGILPELKPLKLLDRMFSECKHYGESLIGEGVIAPEDIKESRSGKGGGSRIVSIGLPAYSILQALLASAKRDSDGLILSDNTEITTENRPKDAIFDWFFDPVIVLKDQIKAQNFSEAEEQYLSRLVLLLGDSKRLNNIHDQLPPLEQRRQAEIHAFARRLCGITQSLSRYPTVRRRFDGLVKLLYEDLEKKFGSTKPVNGGKVTQNLTSRIIRIVSQKSFQSGKSPGSNSQESQSLNNVL
ncbi:uncharacterized membrane protein At3g27390-like [Zingiber officinale]|uniref:Steroid nuclear receptor ligand-binding n=1 Tax=Zingiber officinale TaxID=94328 RepID=A0A8J5FI13_ZINOF|nr:uncharacterized membrane protein At3g27390-like [Zingiber officinale]KAG6486098.1 hypothetical protein ZIOFF_054668 [Zingiber officinale]